MHLPTFPNKHDCPGHTHGLFFIPCYLHWLPLLNMIFMQLQSHTNGMNMNLGYMFGIIPENKPISSKFYANKLVWNKTMSSQILCEKCWNMFMHQLEVCSVNVQHYVF